MHQKTNLIIKWRGQNLGRIEKENISEKKIKLKEQRINKQNRWYFTRNGGQKKKKGGTGKKD